MRYEIKISEIEAGAVERPIFTQVVDTNPLKAVSKAINSTRVRKPKEAPATTEKKGKLL